MYTDERRDFSTLKFFLLRLVLVVIFVLLLIWLVPWPDMSGLKPLQEQIFNNNILMMKDAAIPYFTTDRLPKNVGDKVTLTLQEMLDLKLITPFVDKNGNTCDLTGSYVTLEKLEDEYLLKVNLKCSDKEDYILVHLGCYSYCDYLLCEKQDGKEDFKKPVSKPTSKPNSGTVVKPTAKPNTPTPTATAKPTATTTPKPVTPTATPTTKPNVEYEYEYKKDVAAVYSEWTGWKVWAYKDTDNVSWDSTDTYQIEDLGAQKVVVRYDTITTNYTDVVTHKVLTTLGNYTYKVCTDYKYTSSLDGLYEIISDWTYTNDYYQGQKPEDDTLTSRWVFQGYDSKICPGQCTSHSAPIWRKQTRTVNMAAADITAVCTNVEERSVPIEILTNKTETVNGVTTETVPVYGYVKFYRDRTRTLTSAATIKYSWSILNDQSLLGDGWVTTGNSREK